LRSQIRSSIVCINRSCGISSNAGDRLRYRNVGALEYDRIWSEVEAGRYQYEVVEEDFDVAGYVAEFGRSSAAS
jgi:hypothetical protein